MGEGRSDRNLYAHGDSNLRPLFERSSSARLLSPVGSPLESGVSPAHIGPSNACPRAAPETTPLWRLFLIKLSRRPKAKPGGGQRVRANPEEQVS